MRAARGPLFRGRGSGQKLLQQGEADDARLGSELGFQELEFIDLTPHLAIHDGRVLDEVRANEQDLLKQCGAEYIQRIKTGLGHWVDGGRRGYLQWGILHSRKN